MGELKFWLAVMFLIFLSWGLAVFLVRDVEKDLSGCGGLFKCIGTAGANIQNGYKESLKNQ